MSYSKSKQNYIHAIKEELIFAAIRARKENPFRKFYEICHKGKVFTFSVLNGNVGKINYKRGDEELMFEFELQ